MPAAPPHPRQRLVGPTAPRQLKAREREQRAFDLLKTGMTVTAVAADLGITPSACSKLVRRVIDRMAPLSVADVRDVMVAQIGDQYRVVLGTFLRPNPILDRDGRPVVVEVALPLRDGETVQRTERRALVDQDVQLRASAQLTKIQERLARLMGADAAEKWELTGADGAPLLPTFPDLEAELMARYDEYQRVTGWGGRGGPAELTQQPVIEIDGVEVPAPPDPTPEP